MSCENKQKAVAAAARENGIPKQASKRTTRQSGSLPELLSGETARVRRLLTLKNTKATIPAGEVINLFELRSDQPIAEIVVGLAERFGPEARLAMGQDTLGILTKGQEEAYGIKDIFITLPPKTGSMGQAAGEKHAAEDENIPHLAAIKCTQKQVSGADIARLTGMRLGQQLVRSETIERRFGPEASLAIGKNVVGVISETGDDTYKLLEIFATPPSSADPDGKARLKQADRNRVAININRVHEAIKGKRKIIVLYSGPNGVRRYSLIPLEVAAGKTESTKDNKYLWAYSDKAESVLSMRMDRVLWAKASEDGFDPDEIKAILEEKEPA